MRRIIGLSALVLALMVAVPAMAQGGSTGAEERVQSEVTQQEREETRMTVQERMRTDCVDGSSCVADQTRTQLRDQDRDCVDGSSCDQTRTRLRDQDRDCERECSAERLRTRDRDGDSCDGRQLEHRMWHRWSYNVRMPI